VIASSARLVSALAITQTAGYGILYYAFSVFITPMTRDMHAGVAELAGGITLLAAGVAQLAGYPAVMVSPAAACGLGALSLVAYDRRGRTERTASGEHVR
jgi:hypothetical protein